MLKMSPAGSPSSKFLKCLKCSVHCSHSFLGSQHIYIFICHCSYFIWGDTFCISFLQCDFLYPKFLSSSFSSFNELSSHTFIVCFHFNFHSQHFFFLSLFTFSATLLSRVFLVLVTATTGPPCSCCVSQCALLGRVCSAPGL